MRTVSRRLICVTAGAALALGAAACGNHSAQAPAPTRYVWPDSFAYRVSERWESRRADSLVNWHAMAATLRFMVRYDGSYLVGNEDVVKTAGGPGGAVRPEALSVEDTLHWFVRLGREGRFFDIERGCDPSVAACSAVPLSVFPLMLRRVIPHLPVWWPPRGDAWADTVAFDDSSATGGGGTRGWRLTVYRVPRDTVISGRGYWVLTFYSLTRRWRRGEGDSGSVAVPLVAEQGEALVDQSRFLPALVEWSGNVAVPPAARAAGALETRYRGRAALVGSGLDSLSGPP